MGNQGSLNLAFWLTLSEWLFFSFTCLFQYLPFFEFSYMVKDCGSVVRKWLNKYIQDIIKKELNKTSVKSSWPLILPFKLKSRQYWFQMFVYYHLTLSVSSIGCWLFPLNPHHHIMCSYFLTFGQRILKKSASKSVHVHCIFCLWKPCCACDFFF